MVLLNAIGYGPAADSVVKILPPPPKMKLNLNVSSPRNMPFPSPLVLENRGDLPALVSTDGINYHLLFPREESPLYWVRYIHSHP
jgi:hypothetical protein